MTGYRKIDMAAWPRREHYQYYTEKLKIECNMTVPINVKNLLDFCHEILSVYHLSGNKGTEPDGEFPHVSRCGGKFMCVGSGGTELYDFS